MNNNELLLAVKFEQDEEELLFLLYKDITLKALLEALYYGLKKNDTAHFKQFQEYTKTHQELVVFYRAWKELELIPVKENLDQKLYELGIVTTSCIIIPNRSELTIAPLFKRYDLPALCGHGQGEDKMEYNISTRRITVAEPSVIDILPPGEPPRSQSRSYSDVIVPTVISLSMLCASRGLLALLGDDAVGFSMIAMMMTTSVTTMVTQSYNFIKQGKDNVKSIEEWKTNYEDYLTRIWNRILEWQKSDINYLCTTYPSINELFDQTANLDRDIFARSQNDLDFFKISLGRSEQVEPLFKIKNERKEEISSKVGYIIHKDDPAQRIEIVIPKKEKKTRWRKKETEARPIDHLLSELPYDLAAKEFRYLQAKDTKHLPPLMLDLKNCGALGIIEAERKYSYNFIEHIVFELAYHHTPDDLQFVFFFEQEEDKKKQMERIKNYKNLPHTNELFEDASQFVFDQDSAAVVLSRLQAYMGERTKIHNGKGEEDSTEETYTQIICVIFDDYNIKESGFSKYLPKPPVEGEEYVNSNGLTFIFACRHLAQLPRYCGNIIEVIATTGKEKERVHAKVSSRYNVLSRETLNSLSKSASGQSDGSLFTSNIENLIDYKKFKNDDIFYEDSNEKGKEISRKYEKAFRRLSAIYYRRIAENGNVPSIVTLFQIYGYTPEMINGSEVHERILKQWEGCDVTKDLSVPIGMNEHGIVSLDLHEKADGPHMLVAGTTGSGKSETILTYLIGLCMKFSPAYLNLMLVDMKGGGFSNRLQSLPHCVGVVDDTAGESEGISASYMLKRFLDVLHAEIKRRKILLTQFGVDNVDDYIGAEKKITKLLSGDQDSDLRNSLNTKQEERLAYFIQENSRPEILSHLVLVVDEFTELKRFSNESNQIDFIAEITTIARVGRTLGFHIILVSQNIEGAITEDIRINSKSRLCLRVATRAASKEMLDGRPDAASPAMPGNGRAYLLVGTGSKYIYFQSAYSAANKDENMEPVIKVKQVLPCGKYNTSFYSSSEDNKRIKKTKEKNEKKRDHETQLSYMVQLIEGMKEQNSAEQYYRIPREIFKRPLQSKMIDPTEWR